MGVVYHIHRMKKINNKTAILPSGAALALTLIILLCVSECKALLANEITGRLSGSSNGTGFSVADEFLMDLSDPSRRILATPTIDIGNALKADRTTCNAKVQGSCVPNSKFYNKRPCDYKNTCDRNKANV